MLAALAATAIGYFGGAIALELSTLVAPPRASPDSISFITASVFGLALFWISFPILAVVFMSAILADRLLERLGRYDLGSYIAAGAVLGVVLGAAIVGMLFRQPLRAALCGPYVGVLAAWAYWAIVRPDR